MPTQSAFAPRLDVPLVADETYAARLAAVQGRLSSVHFALHMPGLPDGRHATRTLEAPRLVELLRPLAGIRRHGLLNARFHGPEHYSGEALGRLVRRLESLADAGVLDGLVVGDFYLLTALGRAAPSLAAGLEAVPGINLLLDSAAKVRACLEYIGLSGFRQPSRVVLDRALNRDLPALKRLRQELARSHPGLDLVLLANEGCLARCPFKLAHDSHIAHGLLAGDERAYGLNATLGCAPLLLAEPWRLLASPFIRPEDAGAYAGFTLKLCGRTRGPKVMGRVLEAYLQGHFDGNLLELLDAVEGLAEVLTLDNAALPPDFLERVGTCGGNCAACGWCRELAEKVLRRRAPELVRLG